MKLIALARIGDWLPAGATFEIPDYDLQSAHTLIAAGLAREHAEPASDDAPPSRRTYRRRDLKAEP